MRVSTIWLIFVFACAKSPPPAGTRSVRDGIGRELRLGKVERVISLAPSSTEIVYALGAGKRLVGRDRYSDWPLEVRALEIVGGNLEPSLERIVALRPDVVFTATSANSEKTVEDLERVGLRVFVSRALTLEDVYRDIAAIGSTLEQRGEAEKLVESMRARMQAVAARSRGRNPVRVAVVVWTEPLVVAAKRSHVSDLLRIAGAENVAEDSSLPFPSYSLERLVARAPDLILIGSHADHAPPKTPLERLGMGDKLRPVDGDLLFRPGPRLAEAAEAIEKTVAP